MKQAQRKLSEAKQQDDAANQAKNNFIANMSHEIRTPMTIILSSLKILATTELDEKQQQLLDMANTSSTSLLNIIDDVLDIANIDANRLDIFIERNNLHNCVQHSMDIFTLQASKSGWR